MSEASALAYHRFRLFFFFSGLLLQAAALATLAFSGYSRVLFETAGHQELPYFCLIFFFLTLVSFPLDYASGHVLEKKFSLSKQSLSGWLLDFAKRTLLSLAFFVLTAACFFLAVRLWPQGWWLALALGSSLLSIVLATVFPVLILPLFYPSRPLPDATLKEDLLAWCRQLGFPAMDIRELNFSKKTVKANAALTGFGGTRRVLLGDTLLSSFTSEEIRMVLSHEIGHHVRRHIPRSIAVDLLSSMGAFFLLFLLSGTIARWAGVGSLADPRALPALSLLALVAGVLALPLRNALSRQHEREADRYAWETFPSPEIFVSTMEKLAKTNLSHRSPARWEEVLLASHPSIDRRIASAREYFRAAPACRQAGSC